MVDSNGVVLGGRQPLEPGRARSSTTRPARGAPERGVRRLRRRPLLRRSSPITNSPFKIVLDARQGGPLREHHGPTVTWIIFAAFALALFGSLFFVRRALVTTAELQRRELNERHAVEINDNIIQGLALAKYQLAGGRGEGERRPGLGDAARGAAARVEPARRRRGASRVSCGVRLPPRRRRPERAATEAKP